MVYDQLESRLYIRLKWRHNHDSIHLIYLLVTKKSKYFLLGGHFNDCTQDWNCFCHSIGSARAEERNEGSPQRGVVGRSHPQEL